jgi:hypothetical protein
VKGLRVVSAALLCASGWSVWAALGEEPNARFRAANERARAGDYPAAIVSYRQIAESSLASASLYWNWAQAARARGAVGEALWALLMARERDPLDRAVGRAIDQARQDLNLDPAELAPEPLAAVTRWARWLHLGWIAIGLLAVSVLAHATDRVVRGASRWAARVGWSSAGLGCVVTMVALAGVSVRPTAVIVRRGAPLVDAASPTAEPLGSLREGEVVPILERSGEYLRIQDSSGARGWALAEDVAEVAVEALPTAAASTKP